MSHVRLAVVTPYGRGQEVGGVEVFNECLARALGPFEVFSGDGHGTSERFGDLRRIGLEQPVGALRAARALLRRHAEEPFDVILSNGIYGWPLTLARPPVPMVQVYHLTMAGFAHRALALRGDRLTTGHVTAFFDRFAGLGKHVVALSERVLREVQSLYGLRGQLLPIPVDTDMFRPVDRGVAREVLGLSRDGPIGLFVGRLDRTKGYDVLLEVAARMPDVRFLVAGGHGAPQANVEYLGRVAHDAMPLWYAASDFFFLPSRYEGFGLALLEALSCDVPAIVSESAWPFPEGPAECGTVVPGEAVEDFVAAIRTILGRRAALHPREFVVPRCNFEVFRSAWRHFMDSLPNEAG